MADLVVPAGRSWFVADAAKWPAFAKAQKQAGAKTWTQKLTWENKDRGEVFVVAEFSQPTTLPSSIVRRVGPVKSTDDEDPTILGVWSAESPSLEHYVYETGDAIEEFADNAADAIASVTGLVWGVAAIGAIWLFSKRK